LNWTKIKNIILAFLIVMNIFMLFVIAFTSNQKTKIDKKVIDSSISVLRKSGFKIKKEDFPDSYYKLPSYSATFYSAGELSELFFKKQIAFSTSENSLIASENNKKLTVSGNHFIFESNCEEKKSNHDEILTVLEEYGIDMQGAVYDTKNDCFYRMFNNANLFNMSIQAKIDKNGDLCYVNAYWPKSLKEGKSEELSFIENAIKLKALFPEGGRIQKIELGYSLQDVGGENYSFIPAWRVSVDGELKIIE